MNIKRLWQHLIMTRWQMNAAFSPAVLDAITAQVKQCENAHGGEIRVAIEAELSTQALFARQSTRARAIEVFANLHVWDTHERNGVLIYVCLADRAVEIVADRGLEGRVSPAEWNAVCRELERGCAQAQYQQAMCGAIQSVSQLMARHFPIADKNEQPDRPVLL